MKVTTSSTYRLMNSNLNRININIQKLYLEAATTKKFNSASDNPSAVKPVLTTRTELSRSERYISTMETGLDKLQFIDTYMNTTENILQRVSELTIEASKDSLTQSDRDAIADEIAVQKDLLLSVANAKIDGKYVFSGYQEGTVPFQENPNYDPALYDPALSTTWPYIYHGDNNVTSLEIAAGERMEVSVTGNELFLGISNSDWNGSTADAGGQPAAGQVDIFSVLTQLEEAVRAGNIDDPNGPGGSLQTQLENIETAAEQNRRMRSRLGAKAAHLEDRIFLQQGTHTDLKAIISRYEDADVLETFSQIAAQETAYQAALNVTSRVSNISILNYL